MRESSILTLGADESREDVRLGGPWAASTERVKALRVQRKLKRALDVVVSAAALTACAPLLLLIAVAIKLDSRGPILFDRTRVGMDGRLFTMHKFRTMTVDAEQRLADLEQENEGGARLIKIRHDPRITPVGRWLRRYSLDELPQLVNVIQGDMSLVGPRPQYPSEVALYTEHQRRRLAVPAGLTGLWQISARDCSDFDEWVRLDLEYVDNWSIWLDLKILAKTLGAVAHGTGH
jgi:lipopolysaccharide/colanic/teichoic acid biosynthesis glycosyltransferase